MDKTKEMEEWFKIAKEDYESAIFLTNMNKKPLEVICFHCQQSAEKDLKGFLVKKDIKIKRTHNLEMILKSCIEIDPKFKKLIKNCIRLRDYAVELRYPYRLEINEKIMEIALKDAELIKEFVYKEVYK